MTRDPAAGGVATGAGEPALPPGLPPVRRRASRLTLLGTVLVALGIAAIAAAWVSAEGIAPKRAEITIHYSSFGPAVVTATAGRPITVVLVNTDPIDHEWLVGDEAFHERHRAGSEARHGARPTEVSIPAGATVSTTVTFRLPGEYRFICHLPGHEAYGMVGVLRVLPAS
jgi:uncharacterized cupredoxin-like copper-binding protein